MYVMIRYMMFKIGLKCVLEALKKPPNNRMFMFGIAALDKFKGKLVMTHTRTHTHPHKYVPAHTHTNK